MSLRGAVKLGLLSVALCGMSGCGLVGVGAGAGVAASEAKAATKAVGQIDAATTQVCAVDLKTMQTAVDAYLAITGAMPTSEDDLVTQGLIREPSAGVDVAADGTVMPAPGGPCA